MKPRKSLVLITESQAARLEFDRMTAYKCNLCDVSIGAIPECVVCGCCKGCAKMAGCRCANRAQLRERRESRSLVLVTIDMNRLSRQIAAEPNLCCRELLQRRRSQVERILCKMAPEVE